MREYTSFVHLLDKFNNRDIDENAINLTFSTYINETDFISILKRFDNGIIMLSLNIQSIRAKFDKLTLIYK